MAKVDIGDEVYDSYVALDRADIILAADVQRAVGWALRNEDAKGRGLASATRMLATLPWCVDPAPTFALAPAILQTVTAMLAADLLDDPVLYADASAVSNVKNVKAGSASVEFFSPVRGGPPIPKLMWTMLKNAGLVGCEDGGSLDDGPFVSGAYAGPDRPLGGRYREDWPVAAQDYD